MLPERMILRTEMENWNLDADLSLMEEDLKPLPSLTHLLWTALKKGLTRLPGFRVGKTPSRPHSLS